MNYLAVEQMRMVALKKFISLGSFESRTLNIQMCACGGGRGCVNVCFCVWWCAGMRWWVYITNHEREWEIIKFMICWTVTCSFHLKSLIHRCSFSWEQVLLSSYFPSLPLSLEMPRKIGDWSPAHVKFSSQSLWNRMQSSNFFSRWKKWL